MDERKFRKIPRSEPSRVGRPTKDYHPLLTKEKEIRQLLSTTLPQRIAKELAPNGSRLTHLYGLPKTHKPSLTMRPILSAVGTYNYELAKWLDRHLKPLVQNKFMVRDTFDFVKTVRDIPIANTDVLVSYDVVSLFTNVSLDETIDYLVCKAFENNWFTDTYEVEINSQQLRLLLEAATKKPTVSVQRQTI